MAARALRRAAHATSALREFSFTAATTLAAKQTVRTTLAGRVVRGTGVAYRLTVGGKQSQVIRIRNATYVRPVPGQWAKVAKPRAVVHPDTTLLELLNRLTPTAVSFRAGVTRVVGVLAPGAAAAVGIPATGAPAAARVLIDRQGRVVAVALRGTATAGTHVVHVSVVTHYGHFGHVPPIRHP